jgi:hypothetical protein
MDPTTIPKWPDDPARKPDAIITPAGWAIGKGSTKLLKHKNLLGPILGSDMVYVRHQGAFNFCTGNTACTMLFPKEHDLHPQSRYTWLDALDNSGVKFGFLRPEALAAV